MSLLSAEDLASLLIFEPLTGEWVREVHLFNSKRKRGKTFVIFRNNRNRVVSTLELLKLEFEDSSFLKNINFKSCQSHDIVSNRVGAGKIARKAAKAWMEESASRYTDLQTKHVNQECTHFADREKVNEKRSSEGFKEKKKNTGVICETKIKTDTILLDKAISPSNVCSENENYSRQNSETEHSGASINEEIESFDDKESEDNSCIEDDVQTKENEQHELSKTIILERDEKESNKIVGAMMEPILNIQVAIDKTSDGWMNDDIGCSDDEESEDDSVTRIENKSYVNDEANIKEILQEIEMDTKNKNRDKIDLDDMSKMVLPEREERTVSNKTVDEEESEDDSVTGNETKDDVKIKEMLEEMKMANKSKIDPIEMSKEVVPEREEAKVSNKSVAVFKEPDFQVSLDDTSDALMHDDIGCFDDEESEDDSVTSTKSKDDAKMEMDSENTTKSQINIKDMSKAIVPERGETKTLNKIDAVFKEPNLNLRVALDDTSDAWMHDDIGCFDDEESEDDSVTGNETKEEVKMKEMLEEMKMDLENTNRSKIDLNDMSKVVVREREETNVFNENVDVSKDSKLKLQVALDDTSDTWIHDNIGCFDDKESEDDSVTNNDFKSCAKDDVIMKDNTESLKMVTEKIDRFRKEKEEETKVSDKKDVALKNTFEAGDVGIFDDEEQVTSYDTKSFIKDGGKFKDAKIAEESINEASKQDDMSKRTVTKTGETKVAKEIDTATKQPSLNLDVNTSDAWMCDHIGIFDAELFEDDLVTKDDVIKENEQETNIFSEKINKSIIELENRSKAVLTERDETKVLDNIDGDFKPIVSKTPSSISYERNDIKEDSKETKSFCLPINELADAWMEDDLGMMGDDDDSEGDMILDKDKLSSSQSSIKADDISNKVTKVKENIALPKARQVIGKLLKAKLDKKKIDEIKAVSGDVYNDPVDVTNKHNLSDICVSLKTEHQDNEDHNKVSDTKKNEEKIKEKKYYCPTPDNSKDELESVNDDWDVKENKNCDKKKIPSKTSCEFKFEEDFSQMSIKEVDVSQLGKNKVEEHVSKNLEDKSNIQHSGNVDTLKKFLTESKESKTKSKLDNINNEENDGVIDKVVGDDPVIETEKKDKFLLDKINLEKQLNIKKKYDPFGSMLKDDFASMGDAEFKLQVQDTGKEEHIEPKLNKPTNKAHESGLVDVLRQFLAENEDTVITASALDETKILGNDKTVEHVEELQLFDGSAETDSDDEESNSDNIFNYDTEDSDLGSSESSTDPESDCECE